MKVYEIRGELTISDDQNHQELLQILFLELKKKGIHFQGITKKVTDEDTY